MNRYRVDELRAEAEAYLGWRCAGYPETTVDSDRSKIKLFQDWLENQPASEQQ